MLISIWRYLPAPLLPLMWSLCVVGENQDVETQPCKFLDNKRMDSINENAIAVQRHPALFKDGSQFYSLHPLDWTRSNTPISCTHDSPEAESWATGYDYIHPEPCNFLRDHASLWIHRGRQRTTSDIASLPQFFSATKLDERINRELTITAKKDPSLWRKSI